MPEPKKRAKSLLVVFCPFCEKEAANADDGNQAGLVQAGQHGRIKIRGNLVKIVCWSCSKEWLFARMKFEGWETTDGSKLSS